MYCAAQVFCVFVFFIQHLFRTQDHSSDDECFKTSGNMPDNKQATTSEKLQNVAANASATTQNAAKGTVGTAGGILGGAVSAAGSAVGSVGKGLGEAITSLGQETDKTAQGASEQICETTGAKEQGQKEAVKGWTILGSQ